MRRWMLGWIALGLGLGGCERFAARSDVAAAVGESQLTAERVAGILAQSGGAPTLQAAEFVSNLWLDFSLFAEAVATNRLGTDSATIARVMWPEVAQARVQLWRDTALARMAAVSPGAVDSTYQAGEVKVFQHIITVPGGATAGDSANAQRAIQQALARTRAGGNFGAIAAEVSVDGSKADQGYLPVGPRGQFVAEFENAAWELQPGQVSDVVKSQFGWHIIRRPTLDEARPRFEQFLHQRQAQRNDSVYQDQLAKRHGLKVAGGAATAMRTAASDPDGSRRSSRALVSMSGGDFTVGDFVRWIAMFPANVRIQIKNAPDSMLTQYAEGLGRMMLLLRQADSAQFQLSAPQWQFVSLKYTNAVQGMRRDLGLEIPELSDSSKLTPDQRSKLAAEKVEDYFGRLLDGRAQMQVLLPPLAADLRARGMGRVNQAGVSRSLELAMAQFRRDSAAAAGAVPAPGLQPAPGGPPVPADSTGR